MDTSEMSVDELEEALAAKRAEVLANTPKRFVEVHGHTFEVKPGIEDSWEAIDFMMAIAEASENEDHYTTGVVKAFALIEAATGYTRKDLYKEFGPIGMERLFQYVFELAARCLPKNM